MRNEVIAGLLAVSFLLSSCSGVGNSQPREDSLPALGDGRRPENEKIVMANNSYTTGAEKNRGEFSDGCAWILYHNGELEITGTKLSTNLKSNVTLADELSKVTVLTLNVDEVGEGTCRDLPAVQDVRLGNTVRKIGQYAFSQCTSLNKVEMNAGLKEIGDYAFQKCSALYSADIPEGVTTMGRELFVKCDSLHSITIASDVGDSSFSGCASLTNVTFTDQCTIIGKNGFSDCTGIKDLTLGSGIKRLEEKAFSGCTNIEYIYIPASLEYVGKMVLQNANRINDVECEDKQRWWSAKVKKEDGAFKDSSFNRVTVRGTKK